jgi:alginate O-acetyltransferase complex protein AlgI
MLFNSFEYFLFLPLVVLIYFLLPYRWRNTFLLISSYFFYMSLKWEFGFLLLFISLVNYYAGLKIGESTSKRSRKLWLTLAIIISLGVLGYFKYAGFFVREATSFLSSLGLDARQSYLKIILPVGISFFTFQALSYTIDVFKEKIQAERSIVDLLLFVSFFPTLLAGPISRATSLLGQLKSQQHFSSDQLLQGAKLILWGLFKKAVIADRLAAYVDQIYASPETYGGSTLFLATFFFTFQLYCDFSGYSDIAIGSANIVGLRLAQNFNLPYLASSIGEFWKRWHMSLTAWFRDYVFLPLSFALSGSIKRERVMLIKTDMFIYIVAGTVTWLLTGLWHGAGYTFLIWGMLQCIFLVVYRWQMKPARKLYKRLGISKKNKFILLAGTLLTFVAVLISWVFFRAENLGDAGYILTHIFTGWSKMPYMGPSAFETVLGFGMIVLLCFIQILQYRGVVSIYMSSSSVPRSLRWAGYAMLLIMIAMFGVSSEKFIYFQF